MKLMSNYALNANQSRLCLRFINSKKNIQKETLFEPATHTSIQQWIMQPLKRAHQARSLCLPLGKPLQAKQSVISITGIKLKGSSISSVKYSTISNAFVELKDIFG